MISVTEAKEIIAQQVFLGEEVLSPLSESVGCVLASEICAPFDLPLFSNSAMDGFAVWASDIDRATEKKPVTLPIQMVIRAGDNPPPLENGMTAKIMTGASIPQNADAVVMKEEVQAEEGSVHFWKPAGVGKNVRYQGEEMRKGETALKNGTVLTPAAVGLLSSLGIRNVPIHRKPLVAVISTGNELVEYGNALTPGKIYESNSVGLLAALGEIPCRTALFPICPDDPKILRKYLSIALKACDFILISGGVSVGDSDYTKSSLEGLGIETCFWKVAQKPGKPLYFGRRENRFVFGLPGNPVSALVCFYEYVRPALRRFLGQKELTLEESSAELAEPYSKRSGLSHFVRAFSFYEDRQLKVRPLEKQGSHILQTFAEANCFLIAPEESETMEKGSRVSVHWLPGHHKESLCISE